MRRWLTRSVTTPVPTAAPAPAPRTSQVPESTPGGFTEPTTKDPVAEIECLVQLGATRVEYREGNGTSWTVMLDPEGNEFRIG